MFWFAIPVAAAVVYAGKKVYDAVSEDSSSSSSTSYSDNSVALKESVRRKPNKRSRIEKNVKRV